MPKCKPATKLTFKLMHCIRKYAYTSHILRKPNAVPCIQILYIHHLKTSGFRVWLMCFPTIIIVESRDARQTDKDSININIHTYT